VIGYFDASALIKRYVIESSSGEVQRLLESLVPVTSRLTEVEISSAVCRRCREGELSPQDRDLVLTTVTDDLANMHVVELAPDVTRRAGALLRRYPLRAADAIQLASCLVVERQLSQPIRFVAYDARLNDVATSEGLRIS
jgi:predicted nucleic acid-binding protein